jgi:transposase-like protein
MQWSVGYALRDRQVEALLREGGVSVDHKTVNRWVLKIVPHSQRRTTAASGRSGSPRR